ncbi:MAG: hypothetical protein EHM50_00895, partial [Lysobacterales bacterium]
MPTFSRFADGRTTLVVAANFLVTCSAFAQELNIPLVAAPPELADFLSMAPAEEVRDRFAVVTGFTQREPADGVPSSQRTDVYLAYDSRNLYAVFVAHDDDPSS